MNRERMDLLLDVLNNVERGEAALLPHTDAEGKILEPSPVETRRLGFKIDTWFCGTAACAAGHLCVDGRARALGLRLDLNDRVLVPHYEGKVAYTALMYFLEITRDEVEYIFNPCNYLDNVLVITFEERDAAYREVSPTKVIARVREVMAKGGNYA